MVPFVENAPSLTVLLRDGCMTESRYLVLHREEVLLINPPLVTFFVTHPMEKDPSSSLSPTYEIPVM